jgi:hypothetical protein
MKNFEFKISYKGKSFKECVWAESQLEGVSLIVNRLAGTGLDKNLIKVYAL